MEGFTRQHPVLDQRTVIADGLMKLSGALVNKCLQLLVVAIGGIARDGVLLGRVVTDNLDVAGTINIMRSVGGSPESSHRTDAAVFIFGVAHYHTVATAGEVDA